MTLALPSRHPDSIAREPEHIRRARHAVERPLQRAWLSEWLAKLATWGSYHRRRDLDARTAAKFPPPPLQPLAAQPSISSVRPLSGDQPLEFGADQKIVWLRPGLQPRTVPVVPARHHPPLAEVHRDDLAHCRSLHTGAPPPQQEKS